MIQKNLEVGSTGFEVHKRKRCRLSRDPVNPAWRKTRQFYETDFFTSVGPDKDSKVIEVEPDSVDLSYHSFIFEQVRTKLS